MNKKGFTLIELLVVIAIIGILSSVVLASLNTARGKGANAAVKSTMANLRAQAELIYDSVSPNSYSTICSPGQFLTMLNSATSTGGGNGACFASANAWSASSPLKVAEIAGSFYCTGSSGASKVVASNVASSTSCQ